MAETIGFIGLGPTGKPMAIDLVRGGDSVVRPN
jgi:3-hydroxyisobutyrate dehydrogenase-like beta-hydroxyacid dehydrogenase